MTYYTHINRGVIDANRKHGRNDPPICFRRGKRGKATYAHEVILPAGSRVIYSPHKPVLPCGARLVIVSVEPPALATEARRAATGDTDAVHEGAGLKGNAQNQSASRLGERPNGA